jgi:uncharacterized membrane protein
MYIIRKLKEKNRLNLVLIIGMSCLFSIVLSAYRIYHTHNLSYVFFWWNLFLAFIPFAISTALYIYNGEKHTHWLLLMIGLGSWLLFFPNSPYIITDMLHLRPRPGMPYWYDVLMSVSFAWNGLMLGLLSLLDIQHVISKRINVLAGWSFAAFAISLGSFGIYLGRFDRWNSWDILTNPFALALDIVNQVIHPFAHTRTVAVTLLFSVFLGIAYILMRLLTKQKSLFSER